MNVQFHHAKSLAIVASLGALCAPAAGQAKSEPILPASCSFQQPTRTAPGAVTGTWVSPAGHVRGGYSVALPTLTGATVFAPCDAGQVDLQVDAQLRAAGIAGTHVTPAGHVKGGYGVALPILAAGG